MSTKLCNIDHMEAQEYATEIVKILVREGYTAYFAGGWVRDYAMGHPSADIDIATDAHPEKILDLFPSTILVGLAFGVVIVVMDGHQFEVATFREDIDYVHGRRPEKVEFTTAQEDAKRRDFTINGMFYDPLTKEIHDFVGGMEDIQRQLIQTIGSPHERFVEDRLRMIRAIRFSCRFGFAIDPETQQAIRENANTLLPAVAMERVLQEFDKMVKTGAFDHGIIEMHRLELLPVIFPTLEEVHLNTIKERVAPYKNFPEGCPTVLYLRELFPESSLDELLYICQMLKIRNRDQKLLIFFHNHFIMLMEKEPASDVEWVHFYADPCFQLVLDVAGARFDDEPRPKGRGVELEANLIGIEEPLPEGRGFLKSDEQRNSFMTLHAQQRERFAKHIKRVADRKPLVTSEHLKNEGIVPGVLMGTLLGEAESLAITHDLDDPQAVLEYLREGESWPHS